METPPAHTLPDYDRLAAVFERYLPLIEPVTGALLQHLPVTDGAQVLDVACGTGEPGLTLARRAPGVQLLGVDAAAGMIELARGKAAREQLSNVRFELGTVEALPCADASIDAVLSRFGLLMFGDVAASARELARVLRSGGRFSLAVWDNPATNTLSSAVIEALRSRVPTDFSAFEALGKMAAGERLREAGFTEAQSEPFSWHYEFPSEDALGEFISGPGVFAKLFETLSDTDLEPVRLALMSALAGYKQDDGSYRIPHTCRLWRGRRW